MFLVTKFIFEQFKLSKRIRVNAGWGFKLQLLNFILSKKQGDAPLSTHKFQCHNRRADRVLVRKKVKAFLF